MGTKTLGWLLVKCALVEFSSKSASKIVTTVGRGNTNTKQMLDHQMAWVIIPLTPDVTSVRVGEFTA